MSNGPRTQLPFLSQRVRQARGLPDTSGTRQPFTPYPALPPGATKQEVRAVLYKDPRCIIVNDAFPKSTVHCLVLPLDPRLRCLNALGRGGAVTEHVDLLRHLAAVAAEYVAFVRRRQPQLCGALRFATGFHAIPSLPTLHMHVISLDLCSPCLKHKKHYNSFATDFFLPTDRVIADLEANRRITLNRDAAQLLRLEEQPLKCLWCGKALQNMPELRQHLRTCPLNVSTEAVA